MFLEFCRSHLIEPAEFNALCGGTVFVHSVFLKIWNCMKLCRTCSFVSWNRISAFVCLITRGQCLICRQQVAASRPSIGGEISKVQKSWDMSKASLICHSLLWFHNSWESHSDLSFISLIWFHYSSWAPKATCESCQVSLWHLRGVALRGLSGSKFQHSSSGHFQSFKAISSLEDSDRKPPFQWYQIWVQNKTRQSIWYEWMVSKQNSKHCALFIPKLSRQQEEAKVRQLCALPDSRQNDRYDWSREAFNQCCLRARYWHRRRPWHACRGCEGFLHPGFWW